MFRTIERKIFLVILKILVAVEPEGTQVCLLPKGTDSHCPPGSDSYTGKDENLSRNKVFSRSRYHDKLLVM